IMPLVEQTKREAERLSSLSHDDLRAETNKLKERIDQELSSIDQQLQKLHQEVAENTNLDINEKESIFAQIDKLEKDRNKELEKVLMKVLPVAFAIVKETARRFKENEFLEVSALDYDRQFAAIRDNVQIEGNKARWHNQWKAAGN